MLMKKTYETPSIFEIEVAVENGITMSESNMEMLGKEYDEIEW